LSCNISVKFENVWIKFDADAGFLRHQYHNGIFIEEVKKLDLNVNGKKINIFIQAFG